MAKKKSTKRSMASIGADRSEGNGDGQEEENWNYGEEDDGEDWGYGDEVDD